MNLKVNTLLFEIRGRNYEDWFSLGELQHHGIFFFFLVFLGPHLQHMEVPRLGVELKLKLPAYTTGTAKPDPSCVGDLYHRMLDLQPTEQGQGLYLHPYGY